MQLYTKILIGMAVGILLGFLVGPNSEFLSQDAVKLTNKATITAEVGGGEVVQYSQGIETAEIIGTESHAGVDEEGEEIEETWLNVRGTLTSRDILRLKKIGVISAPDPDAVDAEGEEGEEAKGPAAGDEFEGWVQQDPEEVKTQLYASIGQTLIDYTEWLGRLFLALIKMVVVPLVFCSLLVGIAGLGDPRKLGRMGGRTLGFFFATTVAALTIGVTLANIIAPGNLLSEQAKKRLQGSYSDGASDKVNAASEAPTFTDQIVGIVPANPLESMANGDMLQVIFFAAMLGIALTLLGKKAQVVVDVTDSINGAMVVLVTIAMELAPYGVAALLFQVAGTTGMTVLLALGAYGGVVVLGLLLHLFITYGAVIRLGVKLPFFQFLGAIKEALLLAFSTSSSSATLPVTMRCCEDNVGVSKETTSFVLPLGATVNMDGTALYQGVAAIFIAQVYGIDLTLGDQLVIVTSATMASIGAAGVPGAGMITLAMVLTAIGVPTEGLALVLGVDRLLDMFRTSVNVVGDSTACAFMARLEGDDLKIMTDAEDAANPSRGFDGRLDHDPLPIEPTEEVPREPGSAQ
jgi:Na+/H+-dicarboxylate symporter